MESMAGFFYKKLIMVSLLLSIMANNSCGREKPYLMKTDKEVPWDGVERRKRERRNDEVRKCFKCSNYFPVRDILNICPDCVRKVLMLYKQGDDRHMKL